MQIISTYEVLEIHSHDILEHHNVHSFSTQNFLLTAFLFYNMETALLASMDYKIIQKEKNHAILMTIIFLIITLMITIISAIMIQMMMNADDDGDDDDYDNNCDYFVIDLIVE